MAATSLDACDAPRRHGPGPTLFDDDDDAQAAAVFARTGGVASCDQVARLMRSHCSQPVSRLARWIVCGAVVSYEHCGQRLLPLFQFDPGTMTPRSGVSALVRALSMSRGERDTALWFARAHPALDGATPADLIEQDDGGDACWRAAQPTSQ